MCGITGWIGWEGDLTRERTQIEAMAGTLACRGPDAGGVWLSPRCALGHRRLIVVDPAGGGQPMVRHRGNDTFVITYNGELYNTPELRQELIGRGHGFAGHSDTEVLLTAFMEWGPACLGKLNGIFAFAIWNETGQELFLARDRLGVKPLFFAQRGNTFLFGSELKALLAHPAVPPEIDAEGLAEVLLIGPARTPGHGVLRGVAELRPGWSMTVNRQGVRQQPYWTLPSAPHPDDLPTTVVRVRELVQDAVERQLVADVPVCTLLSGGLDSSALTAFAAAAFRTRGLGELHTWSVDYRDNALYFQASDFQPNDDAPWVQRMSSYLETRHHPVIIDTPALVEALVPAMRARDLPGMADVDASLYLFCQQIKREATVALSGECADEVFGGYPWFHRPELLHADTFPWSRNLAARVSWLAPDLVARLQPQAYVDARYREALAEVPHLPGEDPAEARLRAMFYLNLTRWMPTLLDRKDRMSMAAGLEVRVPFCDHRLVEYVWNVPWAMKCCDSQAKGLLRRALTGVLPTDVLTRRKSPYPKTHHPAYLAGVREAALQILNDTSSPLQTLVQAPVIRELARGENAASAPPWFGQLMGGAQLFAYLVQVDAWLREYRVRIVA